MSWLLNCNCHHRIAYFIVIHVFLDWSKWTSMLTLARLVSDCCCLQDVHVGGLAVKSVKETSWWIGGGFHEFLFTHNGSVHSWAKYEQALMFRTWHDCWEFYSHELAYLIHTENWKSLWSVETAFANYWCLISEGCFRRSSNLCITCSRKFLILGIGQIYDGRG